MPLCIGRQRIAARRHRLADADGCHDVLQRLAGSDMHGDIASGHQPEVVVRGRRLHGCAMDVVVRPIVEGQRHPGPARKRLRYPCGLGFEYFRRRRIFRREEHQAVRHAAQVGVGCLRRVEVARGEPILAFRRPHSGQRDQLAQVAVSLPVASQDDDGEGRGAVGVNQTKRSAHNQLEAVGFRFRMGSHNTGQRALIRNGDGAIAKGGGALHQLFRARSPFQESEIGEAVEFGVLGQ
ncbi:hypothetical protein D9X30_3742 [Cupriavidus sp. U2]|nr:hypothetical protein D9X30_3742 [Cupriavidus sp. U2]